jgi:hypothetical protein
MGLEIDIAWHADAAPGTGQPALGHDIHYVGIDRPTRYAANSSFRLKV